MKNRLGSWAGFLAGAVLFGLMGVCPFARAGEIGPSRPDGIPYAISPPETRSAAVSDAHAPAKRFFAEFRARAAQTYGHLYVLYGEVNNRNEIVTSHIAGFFPGGDTRDCENCGVYLWTIGHLIFVPSEIGASDGDLEEKYVEARFRVWLDAAEYKQLVGYIAERKANKPLWNALWKNCVGFGRDVAEFLNLKVPVYLWLEPKDFVAALRKANGVENPQPALKDAPGSGGATTNSAAKTPSPTQKPKTQPAATVQPAAAASRS